MLCTAALESHDTEIATQAKMQLIARTTELMPQGKPNFLLVRPYPMVSALIAEHGAPTVHKAVLQLIKNFCASLNVVRNMSEDQMIEAAAMLIDECGNFRLEDYVMMFAMGKRGELVKILDRVDIQVIGLMLDEYWERRNAAGNRELNKTPELSVPADAKMADPKLVQQAMQQFVKDVRQFQADRHEESDTEMEARRVELLKRQRAMWEGLNPDLPDPYTVAAAIHGNDPLAESESYQTVRTNHPNEIELWLKMLRA